MATYGQFLEFGPYYSSGSLCTLKIYHYEPGSTTLKNVWTDREKTTTAAQPLLSDANGIASCYADGLYKFRIDGSTDGSTYTTLYTYDKVSNVDQTTSTGEGAALASATTITLGTDGDQFHVTGSTGPIGALSGTQTQVVLVFDSTPTLTHSGNLILLDKRDYVAEAGDVFTFMNDGSGVWREIARRTAYSGLTTRDHGQCRLAYVNATSIKLSPYNGNKILIKDSDGWKVRTIPSAGVTAANTSVYVAGVAAQNLAVSTLYYVYLFDNAGTLTIDYRVTAYATDADTGVTICSGVATRTLVGMIKTNGSAQFEDQADIRHVSSWFSQRLITSTDSLGSDATSTSTSWVEIDTGLRPYFLAWTGYSALLSVVGSASNSTDQSITLTALSLDSSATPLAATTMTASAANGPSAIGLSIVNSPAEGSHYVSMLGSVNLNTGKWLSADTAGGAGGKVRLSATVWG